MGKEGKVRFVRSSRRPTEAEKWAGFLAASFFSIAYIVCPLWLFVTLYLVLTNPLSPSTWLIALPILASALTPPIPSARFLQAWPFKHLPAYFDYEEIQETTDEQVQQALKSRHLLVCAQPHGVFSFGGACAGVAWSQKWWDPAMMPTAVASSVMALPLVKHLVGLFGMCDASPKSLTNQLTKSSVVLYIGGIAELFLASDKEERLYLNHRKGFIKLALRTGADVLPVYFFGNTTTMRVLTHPILRQFARVTGVSLTWFWGRWGLPLPLPRKVVGVVGTPLNLPHIAQPTPQDVERYHAQYAAEVKRIFDTYKKYNPDYAHKTLAFE